MKRYEHYGSLNGGGPAEAIEEPDGDWVRYEDAVAALAAERKRVDELLAQVMRAKDDIARLSALTYCGCGDQFSLHDPGTCGACMASMPSR